jgi:competence protein ComEC
MGDAGLPAERWLRGRVGRVDLLKVGHHGSRGASGDRWLDELRPTAAVISVGRRNTYGHPSPDALERLRKHGIAIWRTDRDGNVEVTTDGATMTVQASGGRATYAVVQAKVAAQ